MTESGNEINERLARLRERLASADPIEADALRREISDLETSRAQIIGAPEEDLLTRSRRQRQGLLRTLLTALQEKVRAEQVEQFRKLSEENQAKSEEFLQANKSKTGIVALPSGVQYRIIEEGNGARPGLESKVTVHYRGSKLDGREFDSSFARGTPEEFTVNAVLKGWQEVLPLMKAGSTWQIFVPPELAFGARGNPPVGPNEALMFDLKLIEILQ